MKQLPSLKMTVILLIVSTIFMPVIGIMAAIWLLSAFIAYKMFPVVAHVVLYGAVGISILIFIANIFYG